MGILHSMYFKARAQSFLRLFFVTLEFCIYNAGCFKKDCEEKTLLLTNCCLSTLPTISGSGAENLQS